MAQELTDTEQSCKARDFAKVAHRDQKYGGRPYVDSHVAAVVRVLEDFGYHDLVDAGWLHDVLEDTPIGLSELRAEFGNETTNIVWAVTGVGENRKSRNQCIYTRIARFPRAAIVKVADRIANVEASAADSSHREMYKKEAGDFDRFVASLAPDCMAERLWAAYG